MGELDFDRAEALGEPDGDAAQRRQQLGVGRVARLADELEDRKT